jgi:MFS family permease
VVAAFLNLFFSVGIIFYGFPVFYPAFTSALGFSRSQVTQGFLLGFLLLGLPCGLLTGILIDRVGARRVILSGVSLVGFPLIFMGFMALAGAAGSVAIYGVSVPSAKKAGNPLP